MIEFEPVRLTDASAARLKELLAQADGNEDRIYKIGLQIGRQLFPVSKTEGLEPTATGIAEQLGRLELVDGICDGHNRQFDELCRRLDDGMNGILSHAVDALAADDAAFRQ